MSDVLTITIDAAKLRALAEAALYGHNYNAGVIHGVVRESVAAESDTLKAAIRAALRAALSEPALSDAIAAAVREQTLETVRKETERAVAKRIKSDPSLILFREGGAQ